MPARLGRYEVRAKVAEGGMATIYLGRRVAGEREPGEPSGPVALKVIKDEFALNREFVNMFLDEAEIVGKLSHPNVVQLYELGAEGNRPFIAMELILGQSLWAVWAACRERGVRLRYDLAAWIGARVADGLHHAHELENANGEPQHIVHRDVNASNILLTYTGEVKVVDFGLAKAVGRLSRTAAGVVKGKLAYMSPEQTAGRSLDRRTDVFALGTTLWELTTDRRLFKGKDDVATLTAVHRARVPDPTRIVAGYPADLWAALRTALERDREKRFATARDFGVRLDACARMEGREVHAGTLAKVMASLFDSEQRRQASWLVEASAADRSAPLEALHRPPVSYRSMSSTVPPEEGMFEAADPARDSSEQGAALDEAPADSAREVQGRRVDSVPESTPPPLADDERRRHRDSRRRDSILRDSRWRTTWRRGWGRVVIMVVTASITAGLAALAAVAVSRC